MRNNLLIVTFFTGSLFTATACAPKAYHAPAMGAETQFDKGLPREKHTRHLYSRKERKEMARLGYPVQ